MFKHLYYRLLLAVLPSVENHLNSIAGIVAKLEALTNKLEQAVEEEVVNMANNVKARRDAIAAIDATYDHKNDISAKVVAAYQTEIAKAHEAKAAVAKLLGL
jgi:hypothetical protein